MVIYWFVCQVSVFW